MNRIRKLGVQITLGLALAGPAIAVGASGTAGFGPGSSREFARSHVAPGDRAADVALAAEQWRAGLVKDPVGWLRSRSALEQAVFTGTLGGMNASSGYYVSWLFRTALVLPGAPAHEPVASFYNPLVDVALIATWRRIDSTWRLSSLFAFDGATLRDAGIPAWNQAQGSYADALVAATRAVRTTAAQIVPGAILPPTIEGDDLRARVEGIRLRLQALAADENQARAADTVRNALVNAATSDLTLGDDAAPSDMELEALDATTRASLVPVAAFDRADGGTSVVIATPFRPELLLFSDFATGNPPDLLRINVVNLGAAPAATVSTAGADLTGASR